MPKGKINSKDDQQEIWINPTGGYGDILMLSGVLKQCFEKNPHVKYNLVRRAIYTSLLKGHPAIKSIGHPPKNANFVTTDYWLKEKLGAENQRPFQILARLFGLQTPIEENLYLPGEYNEDRLLQDFIPLNGKKIAIIAPSSISPRKMMDPMIWQELVEKLENRGIFVIQVGHKDDIFIKGSYSLLGLTTLHQLISILNKSDVIVSVDNFIMHAAHLIGKPAIIIWGPTNSAVYGYFEQIHLQCSTKQCEMYNECLGPDFPDNYKTLCPFKIRHCMNGISVNKIIDNACNICFS